MTDTKKAETTSAWQGGKADKSGLADSESSEDPPLLVRIPSD